MRTVLVTVAAVFLLAACSRNTRPVPAQCNPICFLPCVAANGDAGVRWEAVPSDPAAWDALGGEVVPALADKLRVCEVRRLACEQCLRRLDDAKVIQLGASGANRRK